MRGAGRKARTHRSRWGSMPDRIRTRYTAKRRRQRQSNEHHRKETRRRDIRACHRQTV